jgi:hypothetical protein
LIGRGPAAAGLLTLAVLTGCGSTGSGPSRAADQPSATGTPSAAAHAAAPGGGGTSAAPSAADRAAGPSATPASAASAASSAQPDRRGDRAAATAADRPVTLPAPGTYHYRVTGTSSSAFGDQQIDERSDLTVEQPKGNRERATLRDQEGSTTQVLVARRAGLFLAEIDMSRQGFSETFHPDRSAQLISARPTAGESWSWRMQSDDGDYTLRARLTVTDDDAHATVGGRRVPAVRVASVLVVTGDDIRMRIRQNDLATLDGTVVREHAVGSGTAYGMQFHSDTTRRLDSAG